MERVPVSIYSAITPNPNVVKFITDIKVISPESASAEFKSLEEAKGHSPLAVALFENHSYIRQVYICENFISVTKDEAEMEWGYLVRRVRDFIYRFILMGNPIVTKIPTETSIPKEISEKYAPSEFDDQIKELMDKFVKDPVQGDGGEITFRNYKDGVVTVLLKGACVGCPARNKTLKLGIEEILKKYIPEITDVIAENG